MPPMSPRRRVALHVCSGIKRVLCVQMELQLTHQLKREEENTTLTRALMIAFKVMPCQLMLLILPGLQARVRADVLRLCNGFWLWRWHKAQLVHLSRPAQLGHVCLRRMDSTKR